MIKYFVRTTGKRTLDESFSQIQYELLVDKNHKFPNIFVDQLRAINDYDAVLMEDDIILCKDFKNRIEEVISKYPKDIINFFTLPMKYLPPISFPTYTRSCYNQCMYFPKGVAGKMADIIEKYHINNGKNTPEMMIKQVKRRNPRLTIVNYRPCLVQHIDNNSLIGNGIRVGQRRSPYFIDYLEELNIDYLDAHNPINEQKLIDLMNEKFKDVDNEWKKS